MHNEHFNKQKIRLISLVSFLFGFLDAFFIYVLSSFFSEISGSTNVGIFYFISYSIVLVSLFFLQPLIRRIGRSQVLYLALGISVGAAMVLAVASGPLVLIGAALLLIITTNITWVSLDILLENFSQDRVSGSIRGLYLTIMNTGLLAAPFLSLKTLDAFGYDGIFLILVIGYVIVFIITLLSFRHDNQVFQKKIRFGFTIRKILSEKNLLRIFYISFAMEFFYALMIVYTPIYLRTLGYDWDAIGIMFTVMLIPFVVLQYPLGVLADRYFGEKEMLMGSIIIVFVATAALPAIGVGNVATWALMLLLTRIGIAGIEILRDAYFYKQIDANDMDIIAFFRTARPLANIIGAIISVPMLLLFPLQSIFIIVAGAFLFAFFQACSLQDSQSLREEAI